MFEQLPFRPTELLLPKEGVSPETFAVIACDQHTAEPEYWQQVQALVGTAPSALRLILPEYRLGGDVQGAVTEIQGAMEQYLQQDVFARYENAMIYVERRDASGKLRRGLVGAVDLEQYEYIPGNSAPVRATEETVAARIPPRAAVRRGGALETSHVMMLCDDVQRTVIEPLTAQKEQMTKLYDFDLMLGGGHLAGWLLGAEQLAQVERALAALQAQCEMLFAVGDGNHSLATAKTLHEEQPENERARYALCELINLYDESLQFEPIHRVVFGVDKAALQEAYHTAFGKNAPELAQLQAFLDDYVAQHGGEIDYIHGDETAQALGVRADALCFLCSGMEKRELFPYVMEHGVLPRKTFSMGHGDDKRFYMECREIK